MCSIHEIDFFLKLSNFVIEIMDEHVMFLSDQWRLVDVVLRPCLDKSTLKSFVFKSFD